MSRNEWTGRHRVAPPTTLRSGATSSIRRLRPFCRCHHSPSPCDRNQHSPFALATRNAMTRRREACARRGSRVGQLAWLQRVNRPRARASLIWFTQLQGQRSKCAHEYARTQSVSIHSLSLSCTRPPFFCPVFWQDVGTSFRNGTDTASVKGSHSSDTKQV